MRHIAVVTRMGGGVFALIFAMNAVSAQEVVELPGADRALSSDYEEVYRVGSFDGDVWETFGDIAATGFDENGNLYIFDRQASRIVVVDSAAPARAPESFAWRWASPSCETGPR